MKRCKSCGACQECGAPAPYWNPRPILPWMQPHYPSTVPYPTTSPYWPTTTTPYPTITYASSSTGGVYTTFKTNDGPDEAGALAPLH